MAEKTPTSEEPKVRDCCNKSDAASATKNCILESCFCVFNKWFKGGYLECVVDLQFCA